MLLKHFDNSRQYVGVMKTTAVLKENRISLQLHTNSGAKPLTDDHIVDGWKLKPKEDLTVDYKHLRCSSCIITISQFHTLVPLYNYVLYRCL